MSTQSNNPENIVEGNIVFLKTGTKAMTVDSIKDNIAKCVWEEGSKSQIASYKLTSLTKIRPAGQKPDGLYVG